MERALNIAQSSFRHKAIDLDVKLNPERPLLRYAALYWPEHAEDCSTLANVSGVFLEMESPLRVSRV